MNKYDFKIVGLEVVTKVWLEVGMISSLLLEYFGEANVSNLKLRSVFNRVYIAGNLLNQSGRYCCGVLTNVRLDQEQAFHIQYT